MDTIDSEFVHVVGMIVEVMLVYFPSIGAVVRNQCCKALLTLWNLYSTHESLFTIWRHCVSRAIAFTLSDGSLQIKTSLLSATGTLKQEAYKEYLLFWNEILNTRSLMLENNIDPKSIEQFIDLMIDEIIHAVIAIPQKLDLSIKDTTMKSPIKHADAEYIFETQRTLQNSQSQLSDNEACAETDTFQIETKVVAVATHPKDHQVLINLVQFCKVFSLESLNIDFLNGCFDTDQTQQHALTVKMFSNYVAHVLRRMWAFKDDLLCSCLSLVLSAPFSILDISKMQDAMQTAFSMGTSYFPMAVVGLDALERWIKNSNVENDIIPRISYLAEFSPNRKVKVAALELLYSLILLMIGRIAFGLGHVSDTRCKFHDIFEKVFPCILRIAVDVEPISRSLFQPLLLQIIRWLSISENRKASETAVLFSLAWMQPQVIVLLNVILAANPLPSFCFILKNPTDDMDEDSKDYSDVSTIFIRIYHLLDHHEPHKRLGACMIVGKIKHILQFNTQAATMFTFEMLYHSLYALRISDRDEVSDETVVSAQKAVESIAHIIVTRVDLFKNVDDLRRLFPGLESSDLLSLIKWLFGQFGSVEYAFAQAYKNTMFDSLIYAAPNYLTDQFFLLFFKEIGDMIVLLEENGFSNFLIEMHMTSDIWALVEEPMFKILTLAVFNPAVLGLDLLTDSIPNSFDHTDIGMLLSIASGIDHLHELLNLHECQSFAHYRMQFRGLSLLTRTLWMSELSNIGALHPLQRGLESLVFYSVKTDPGIIEITQNFCLCVFQSMFTDLDVSKAQHFYHWFQPVLDQSFATNLMNMHHSSRNFGQASGSYGCIRNARLIIERTTDHVDAIQLLNKRNAIQYDTWLGFASIDKATENLSPLLFNRIVNIFFNDSRYLFDNSIMYNLRGNVVKDVLIPVLLGMSEAKLIAFFTKHVKSIMQSITSDVTLIMGDITQDLVIKALCFSLMEVAYLHIPQGAAPYIWKSDQRIRASVSGGE
ncbi:hypothetical protein BSLG_005817 [Batrachochytrium salamandrivorans]|nr:hypothetical protein BSLG_005817 [Batrachochytrium salamandrivorans]